MKVIQKFKCLFKAPRVEGKPLSIRSDRYAIDEHTDYYYYPRWRKVLLHWHLIKYRFLSIAWYLPRNTYHFYWTLRKISSHKNGAGGLDKYYEGPDGQTWIAMSPLFILTELDWNKHESKMGRVYQIHFFREEEPEDIGGD